jgi:UDP-glucose:tetrahydrobiopterin glucosyltransferase
MATDPLRILLASTPVGPLGSGIGGGVELTLHNLVYGLSRRGHHVEVVAPAGSLHVGQRVHQIEGSLQVSSQVLGRDAPVTLRGGSVLAAMWNRVADLQGSVDIVINFAYDWLPLYLTRFLTVPVVHLISMGSLNDSMDHAIIDIGRAFDHRLAAHGAAQAATYANEADFRVVGNGIVIERYDLQLSADADQALGFIGRISPEKGIEDIAELSARTGRVVKVWGMLQDPSYWQQVLADHPSARLDYQGFIPTDDLQAAIGRCSAIVMTPKWVEAFGNVAIEAMATGVPVITYDRGGPAEIVEDGVTGFVVPADDVDALIGAVGRIGTIDRGRCRQRIEDEYSSLAMADRVVAWLNDAIESVDRLAKQQQR